MTEYDVIGRREFILHVHAKRATYNLLILTSFDYVKARVKN